MQYLLAHDLGTSGDKVSLYTVDGALASSVTVPYTTHYFNHNWAEQDTADWWSAVCRGTWLVLERIGRGDVLSCISSFSGQKEEIQESSLHDENRIAYQKDHNGGNGGGQIITAAFRLSAA